MNLIEFLKRNENTRKIFGERELKIIEKQLWGVNLTQSEKNRLSRDIRRKFDFIKEILRHSFDFRLKKGSETKNLIEEMKDDILKSKYSTRIRRIALFGSTAEKQRRLGSDIDIAVEFDKIGSKEATEFGILFGHDKRVQVEVYNVLPDKLKAEINKKGKVIYERQDK